MQYYLPVDSRVGNMINSVPVNAISMVCSASRWITRACIIVMEWDLGRHAFLGGGRGRPNVEGVTFTQVGRFLGASPSDYMERECVEWNGVRISYFVRTKLLNGVRVRIHFIDFLIQGVISIVW